MKKALLRTIGMAAIALATIGTADAANFWFQQNNVTYVGQVTKKFPAFVIQSVTITYDRFAMHAPESGETIFADYAIDPQPGGTSLYDKSQLALYNTSYNNLGAWLMGGWDINELRTEAGLATITTDHYGFWIDAKNDGTEDWVDFLTSHGGYLPDEQDVDLVLYFSAGQDLLGSLRCEQWTPPSLLVGGTPSSDPDQMEGVPILKFSVNGQKDRYGHQNNYWNTVDHSPYVLSAASASFLVFYEILTNG